MKRNLKNENGVTLIVLIVTMIVMIIIASITIKQGLTSVNTTQDNVIETNLRMVQQALLEEYTKSKIQDDGGNFKGRKAVEVEEFKSDINNSKSPLQGDKDSYYIVTSDDLEDLGIEVSDDQTYVVDYSTGEIWDLTNKKYEDDTYAYLGGVTTQLGNEHESYADSSIVITLVEDIKDKGNGNYEFKVKVEDDLAKIGDPLTKDDVTNNKVDIKNRRQGCNS